MLETRWVELVGATSVAELEWLGRTNFRRRDSDDRTFEGP